MFGPERAHASQVQIACANASTDAATINAAIGGSNVGDEIVFKGTCLINQVIKLKPDRSYRGESRTGTVLKQANNANLVGILVSEGFVNNTTQTDTPVSVRQLTIDGNKANNTTAATSGIILRSWESVVKDVYVTGMKGNGIRVTNQSANGTEITNTQVNGQIVGNFIEDSGQYGVFIEDSGNSVTDWQLTDNWIAESGVDGIHMDNAAGWYVERNHIYGVPQNAIYANRMYGTSISDNYIEGFGEGSASGTYYGIQGTVQADVASTIANNRVFRLGTTGNAGSTFRFIGLTAVNYDGKGVVNVNGNSVRGQASAKDIGLYYAGSSSARTLLVLSTDNLVTDVGTAKTLGSNATAAAGN
ncbi:right-handed parallel beta-helix repeat-containing protein [Cohnella sp. CBP 2801]|uniref:Right-handed parallel beta-helix repeat-containing protein n=2 Tax=Cohnella zeiphila TaxID=2761120 RepID=A0A7X0VVE9_9BACL|nr:right-handed parallel beta-helix repeat-containing protein [Cohnella zeiphila]